jgi:hypothetical protein
LVPPKSNVLLSEMSKAQFLATQLAQNTLVGLVFSLVVVGVARDQPVAGPTTFKTDIALDPPLCEKINYTLGISIII